MEPVNIQRVVLLTSLPFWLYSVTMLIADFNSTSMLMEGNYRHPEWQNFAIEETITERTIPVKKIIMVWKPIINKINSSVAVLSKSKKRRIREPTLPYNLMEESSRRSKRFATDICSLEYANLNRLQQDHPCVVDLVRRFYLHQPAPWKTSYDLDHPEVTDPSDGRSEAIYLLLRNQTKGFFVECGALDGEFLSNTMFMERFFNWTGVLIEAGRASFHKLKSRQRKAYSLPICLSTESYPLEVDLETSSNGDGCTIDSVGTKARQTIYGDEIDKAQCFPLYSVLLAVNRTQIDYLSINVKGSDLIKVLKTIPWNKVDITTLSIRWNRDLQIENAASRLMKRNGYIKMGLAELYHATDIVYFKDFF